MKKSIVILCWLTFNVLNVSAIDVGGIISSDTTWSNTTEAYYVSQPIQIAYGTTLTISKGVRVEGGEIHVYGELAVVGTENSKVSLSNVKIIPGDNSSSEPSFISITHAAMIGGAPYLNTPGSQYGSLLLQDSYLKDLDGGYGYSYIYLWYPTSDVIIRRNIFENFSGISVGLKNGVNAYIENNHFKSFNQSIYVDAMIESWATYDSSEVIVRYNSFEDYGIGYAVMLPPGGSSTSMSAYSNYWGTTAENEILQMIYDKNDDLSCAGYIDYTPFLSAHHPDTPVLGAEINVVLFSNGINLPNNSQPVEFECPIGLTSEPEIFEIQNIGNADLTGLSLNLNGSLADEFGFSSLPSSTAMAGDSMTFSITYSPVDSGDGSAQLSITSNDADENPFLINLTAHALSQDIDTDGDGLNDVAEYIMSNLGFHWNIPQENLVSSFSNGVMYAQEYVNNLPCTIYQSSDLANWNEVQTTNFSMSGLSVEMTDEGLSLNLGLNALLDTNSASCMFYKATLD